MAIPEHQIRVIRELEEIETLHNCLTVALTAIKKRSQSLCDFIDRKDGQFKTLDLDEQMRLKYQHFVMILTTTSIDSLVTAPDELIAYVKVLKDRIAAF